MLPLHTVVTVNDDDVTGTVVGYGYVAYSTEAPNPTYLIELDDKYGAWHNAGDRPSLWVRTITCHPDNVTALEYQED